MKISKKKDFITISSVLWDYLENQDRKIKIPIRYSDLFQYSESFPVLDKYGHDTLWDSLIYKQSTQKELKRNLARTYALLKTESYLEMDHLEAERIDYCNFGNSHPFRVKIVNLLNDNYDYMYIKVPDASRIYGLELEHLLSPNYISYLVDDETLVEEHIAGIPGNQFIKDHFSSPKFNGVRFAKEFIKFNERCFVRLLGDMRSYNWVVDVTPDFEDEQYRIKAIDFDQQSYEGNRSVYLPQYFKENNPIIHMGMKFINVETTKQYQYEERTLIARRLNIQSDRLHYLLDCMKQDQISTPEKVNELIKELNRFHKTNEFDKCKNMGDILHLNLKLILSDHIRNLEV
ncbi:MAG: hypothetical protein O2887_15815 [Bacteroidetes bacterium]|nr:hypothetical protein [Bacteroidota bacterium]